MTIPLPLAWMLLTTHTIRHHRGATHAMLLDVDDFEQFTNDCSTITIVVHELNSSTCECYVLIQDCVCVAHIDRPELRYVRLRRPSTHSMLRISLVTYYPPVLTTCRTHIFFHTSHFLRGCVLACLGQYIYTLLFVSLRHVGRRSHS